MNIVAEETSPNHYIKSGNIPLALLLEGSFIPCLKTGSYLYQTTFESVGNKMIVISDGDLIRNQLDKTCNPSSWDTINVPETYMTTRISC
jgi:hypothetical protein